jgi:hypothetical protein
VIDEPANHVATTGSAKERAQGGEEVDLFGATKPH